MECFVIIVIGLQPLTIITKHSILDVAAALDPPRLIYHNLLFFTQPLHLPPPRKKKISKNLFQIPATITTTKNKNSFRISKFTRFIEKEICFKTWLTTSTTFTTTGITYLQDIYLMHSFGVIFSLEKG